MTQSALCNHVYSAVRELGTTIYWDGCDFPETEDDDVFIDHTCNTLDEIESMNCKLYGYEKGEDESGSRQATI